VEFRFYFINNFRSNKYIASNLPVSESVQCSCNKVIPNINMKLYTEITYKYDININMSISDSDEEYLEQSENHIRKEYDYHYDYENHTH